MREAIQAGRVAGHRLDSTRLPLDDSDDSGFGRELDYTNKDIQTVKLE